MAAMMMNTGRCRGWITAPCRACHPCKGWITAQCRARRRRPPTTISTDAADGLIHTIGSADAEPHRYSCQPATRFSLSRRRPSRSARTGCNVCTGLPPSSLRVYDIRAEIVHEVKVPAAELGHEIQITAGVYSHHTLMLSG